MLPDYARIPLKQGECGCLTVASPPREGTLRVQATNSAATLEVTTDGAGIVSHAGVALLRELADRLELTRALGWNQRGGWRRHPDAAVLRDLAVMLADGWDCLSDLTTLGDQPELFGTGRLDPDRVAGGGAHRLRTPRAGQDPCGQGAGAGLAAGGSPDPEAVIVIDLDGTLVCSHGSCGGASEPVGTRTRLARGSAHHRKFH